ncbi:MAG: hypothetical protein GX879_07485 [Bacteroidales bacterium]|nr:hypothetical protein [Bacteroidales bacterium]
MTKKHFFLFILILIYAQVVFSQEQTKLIKNPPINVEALVSNRGIAFQQMANKKMQSLPRLGFFNVINFVGEWDTPIANDLMTQGNITFQIIKGLDIMAGFHLTSVTGFRPTTGLMYSYAKPDFTFVVNPRFDLMKNGIFETFSLIEYRPKINDIWGIYSRLQGVYGHTLNDNTHARSYVVARIGLSYREFNFGLGTNLDWYGPTKANINSFGGFLAVALF